MNHFLVSKTFLNTLLSECFRQCHQNETPFDKRSVPIKLWFKTPQLNLELMR